jgi:SAM-dependent methyltransferase
MDNSVKFWNECHAHYDSGILKEETCWDIFAHQFSAESGPVLDLACGTGSDSFWLKNRGIPSVAGDYSLTGVKLFHFYLPDIPVLCFDMTNSFPFAKETFGMLICDMGLHFFSEKKTISILHEIRRIMKREGTAFFRINAIEDLEPEKIISKIEPHFYFLKDDVNMRYFTKEDINHFFADWSSCDAERTQMTRYGTPRETWILRCQK